MINWFHGKKKDRTEQETIHGTSYERRATKETP
jgi:hypothetical protein